MLLAEPELTRATAARGSGVDVDVEVVGGGASGQSRVIDEQEGRERQHTRQALSSHLSNVAVLSSQASEADREDSGRGGERVARAIDEALLACETRQNVC